MKELIGGSKMKQIIKKSVKTCLSRVLVRLLPINKRRQTFIISRSYQDNCLSFLDYMSEKEKSNQFFLICDKDQRKEMKKLYQKKHNITILSEHQKIVAGIIMLSSKYVYYMHKRPYSYIKKSPKQTVINLWHGSGYKDKGTGEKNWRDGEDFDFVLVPGEAFRTTKSEFFSCKIERVLPLGYPRYDHMLHPPKEVNHFFNRFFSNNYHTVIWMPTFRKTGANISTCAENQVEWGFDIPLLEKSDQMTELDQFLLQKQLNILIKRHPYQVSYTCEKCSYANIRFISNEDLYALGTDVYGVLNQTRALISDYSSIAVDYMLLNKPIAFSLDDFEQYKDTRGFVFDNPLDYMPGHHLYTFDDLKSFLQDISEGKDPYAEERHRLMKIMHNPCESYCERIWSTINNKL